MCRYAQLSHIDSLRRLAVPNRGGPWGMFFTHGHGTGRSDGHAQHLIV